MANLDTKVSHIRLTQSGGGAGAGTNFRDTLQVHPCKLGRDFPVAHGPGS